MAGRLAQNVLPLDRRRVQEELGALETDAVENFADHFEHGDVEHWLLESDVAKVPRTILCGAVAGGALQRVGGEHIKSNKWTRSRTK